MAVLFVLFFNTRVLGGLSFHEIAGLFFASAYFTHIILNYPWVKKVTLMLFNPKLPWSTRGSYALNLLLLISMSFIIISGILISRVVFPNINVANEQCFHMTHVSVSYLVLALVGIHVGLHWHWVVRIWQKIWKYKTKQKWMGYAEKFMAVLILVFGMYELKQTNFMNQLSSSVSFLGSAPQKMGDSDAGMTFRRLSKMAETCQVILIKVKGLKDTTSLEIMMGEEPAFLESLRPIQELCQYLWF